MRPMASTAVASMHSMPAPDSASVPRCTMCHSLALPSREEYWHIGETTTRLGRGTPRCGRRLTAAPASGGGLFVDGIDAIGIEGEMIPDRGDRVKRRLVGPDRVGGPLTAGRNAVIGAVALVGAIGG